MRLEKLFAIATAAPDARFVDKEPKELEFSDGKVRLKDGDASKAIPFERHSDEGERSKRDGQRERRGERLVRRIGSFRSTRLARSLRR